MRTVVFNSPYQAEVEASEHRLIFRRGESCQVEDHVAEALLRHPHFEEVSPGRTGSLVLVEPHESDHF